MKDEERLQSLVDAISDCDKSKCGCPSHQAFELMASEFGYRASNVNAAAMEQFQLNVAAQNALLLRLQADISAPRS